ncbi:efflux RND transporter periplasmic adaptor subunit [Mesorhizobium sp. YIM 152430]|uniref:efflux RND transporter periplasmic adaptor subunit n=1 Tax=Mesorhizobium sp. YIM 152430 TaxID=3031761 RepID=UPI0023DA1B9B|nr:efflux RND transporter periplasmic adaptor subunit [Mesorhizobium sp. YIM 152430]MDF1598304.1 efflux RND transporter periplasmic adaptor subunit [Mesorhizobium sp. YIM 152430]
MDQIAGRPQGPSSAQGATPPIADALGLGKARRRKRRWPLVAALLVLGAAGAYYVFTPSSTPQVSYRTVPAERGSLTVQVSATGTLAPLTQVDVSTELSGVVRSVAVDENQRVSTGDVLAVLDTSRIEAQIERAEANVAAAAARVLDAEVTLTETRAALARAEQLASRGMVADQALETSKAAFDRADSAVAIARANQDIAEAELKLQQADLDKSTIYAPIDGIVLTRSLNPGQTVSASTQAPILFVIAENLERMELKAAIDEADIGQVAEGQTARFTVDAFPTRRFDAEISDIAYASVVTEGVVTYEARLAVTNDELLLRPGMTATVDIVTREAGDALLVPASAFRFSPAVAEERASGFGLQALFSPPRMGMGRGGRGGGGRGGERGQAREAADPAQRTLYVMENGAPQATRVTTGSSDGDRIEIVDGLKDGAEIVIGTRER